MLKIIRHWIERRRLTAISSLCDLPQPLLLAECHRALLFAPHPDDESLGCGGTLCMLAERCAVKVILVTDGGGAGGLPPGAAEIRRQEFIKALGVLGVTNYELWDYTDGLFFDSPRFQAQASLILDHFKPDWVFFPSPLDYHRDHLALSVALQRACSKRRVKQIHYEVWGPLLATHYVDITKVFQHKMMALDCHYTAMQSGPYRTTITGLNAYRGLYMMDREVPRFAEAFCVDEDGSIGYALAHLALRMRIK